MSEIEKRFITFGSNHLTAAGQSLGQCYMIVEGKNWHDIREKTCKIRGRKFCTDYPMEDLPEQISKWNLIEISTEDAQLPPEDVRASMLDGWGSEASA